MSVPEECIWTTVASASGYHERNLHLSVVTIEEFGRNPTRLTDCFLGSVQLCWVFLRLGHHRPPVSLVSEGTRTATGRAFFLLQVWLLYVRLA
jgi:hypothetical protein